jgi:hypothetical protein
VNVSPGEPSPQVIYMRVPFYDIVERNVLVAPDTIPVLSREKII